MTDDVIHSTQHYMNYINRATLANLYVAMVTKLLSLNCGAHLVEFYCKESNISDPNWLKYLFFIIFDQNVIEYMTSSIG